MMIFTFNDILRTKYLTQDLERFGADLFSIGATLFALYEGVVSRQLLF